MRRPFDELLKQAIANLLYDFLDRAQFPFEGATKRLTQLDSHFTILVKWES